MKVIHNSDMDYLSIDFKDEVEARSVYEGGIIVRYDKHGSVIGIDITNSLEFFLSRDTVNMKQATKILKMSESTIRRYIKAKRLKASKPNGKDYVFKKSDLIMLKKAS